MGNSMLSSTVREINLLIADGRDSTSVSERVPSRPKRAAISNAENNTSKFVRSRCAFEWAALRASLALRIRLNAASSSEDRPLLRRRALALSMKFEASGAFASAEAPAPSTKTILLKCFLADRRPLLFLLPLQCREAAGTCKSIYNLAFLLVFYQQRRVLSRVGIHVDWDLSRAGWSLDEHEPSSRVLREVQKIGLFVHLEIQFSPPKYWPRISPILTDF